MNRKSNENSNNDNHNTDLENERCLHPTCFASLESSMRSDSFSSKFKESTCWALRLLGRVTEVRVSGLGFTAVGSFDFGLQPSEWGAGVGVLAKGSRSLGSCIQDLRFRVGAIGLSFTALSSPQV